MFEIFKNKRSTDEKIKLKIITGVLIPIYYMSVLTLFFSGPNFNVWMLIGSVKALAFQALLVILVELILLGIFKKAKNALTAMGIITWVLALVNLGKFAFTGEPVTFSDLMFVRDAGEIMGIVQGELWSTISLHILPFLGETLAIVALIIYGRRVFADVQFSVKTRLGIFFVPLMIMILLVAPIKPVNKFILTNVYDTDKRTDRGSSFISMAHYYTSFGIVGGIYGQALENRIWEPANYSEEKVEKELKSAEDNGEKTLGKPNVIVVFSESFWDIDQLDEVTFNQKVTPNFNRLKEEGLFFNMISPSYGGTSCNVEYEFLTGSNLMYFNYGYVPYMQLYRNDSYYNRPSIIQELKRNGYKTKMVSASSELLFNCGNVYKYMGVDETEFLVNIPKKSIKGQYVSDEFLTDKIIDEFEKKEKDKRLFYMTLTMQAHMPYPKDRYDKYDVWVEKSSLSSELNDTLTCYAQGIYDADKQLGRLADYINTIKEPTIVIFYGDHLPLLYAGKVNALDELKYFNTDDNIVNYFRKYNTQSLVISNFPMKKEQENIQYLGPDLLSAYVLNHMDISLSDYYKWLYSCRNTIAASNYFVTVDQNGKLYSTMSLQGEMKKEMELRRNIEYKLFVK